MLTKRAHCLNHLGKKKQFKVYKILFLNKKFVKHINFIIEKIFY